MKSKLWFLMAALVVSILFLNGCSAISVGVSPGNINFKDLLRNGYAEQEVIVSTSGADTLTAHIFAKGDLEGWMSFDTPTFEIEPRSVVRFKVFINPPEDVANGVYEGIVYVDVRPKEVFTGEGTQIGIGAAAGIKIKAVVTDRQIKRYAYRDVIIKDIEEGNPIEVKLVAINTGNVKVRPEIKVEILDQLKKNVVKSVDYSETEILPTARETIVISIPTGDLKLGQYWARIIPSLDGQKLGEEVMTFDYLERGALRVKGVLNSVRSSVWTQVGDTSRIDAIFSNIGEMMTLAKAKFQIFFDGALKDVIDSEEVRVEVGGTMNMTAFYKPEEVGRYEIVGTVFYSGKITEEKSTILNVNERVVPEEEVVAPAPPSGGADYTWIIVVLAIIIVALFAIRFMNARKRGGSGRKRSGLSGY